jgi:transcriptional regulator with XRE-family HTH domain
MDSEENAVDRKALEAASAFGSLIRQRRKALKMRQDQLALVAGVGRRFLIDLEAGKPSCQLGRSLLVAGALGFKPETMVSHLAQQSVPSPELPELADELEELDAQPAGIF